MIIPPDTPAPLPTHETCVPADPSAVADLIRRAAAANTPIYPIGGGTQLRYGVLPARSGMALSLAKLKRVVDHPVRDLTITVEAGMPLAALAETLAAERQRLPIDVPHPDRATVGGALMTNACGPRRFAWGTFRDYVIGLRVVDGQGMEFRCGGRVVKNAAGYDLCRLMIGSLGTLGVLTEVTLMVRPVPETSAFVLGDVPGLAAAERVLESLTRSVVRPAAIELLAGPAWRQDAVLGPLDSSAAARLVVGFEGTAAEVAWMTAELARQWQAQGVSAPRIVCDQQAMPIWQRLTEFPAGCGPEGQGRAGGGAASERNLLGANLRVLPSRMVAFLETLRSARPQASILAHAGNGDLWLWDEVARPDDALPLVDRVLRPAVAAAGGSLVVTSHPTTARLGIAEVWGPPRPELAVMRRLKRQFDPQHVLNPGRFLFEDARAGTER